MLLVKCGALGKGAKMLPYFTSKEISDIRKVAVIGQSSGQSVAAGLSNPTNNEESNGRI